MDWCERRPIMQLPLGLSEHHRGNERGGWHHPDPPARRDSNAPHAPTLENDPAPPCNSTAFPFRATELVTDRNIASVDRPDVSSIAMSDGIS
jgi:hypothetical protein